MSKCTVRPADIDVIKTVMGNITTQENGEKGHNRNNYVVAINKVSNKILDLKKFKEGGKEAIVKTFNASEFSFGTETVIFIRQNPKLNDQDNARFEEACKEQLFEDLVLNTPTIYRMHDFLRIRKDMINYCES